MAHRYTVIFEKEAECTEAKGVGEMFFFEECGRV